MLQYVHKIFIVHGLMFTLYFHLGACRKQGRYAKKFSKITDDLKQSKKLFNICQISRVLYSEQ